MIRRPPRSTRTDTLFPYTTLFRSGHHHPLARDELDLLALLTRPASADSRFPQSPLKTVLRVARSEEHTSELQSLMRISYAVFCLKKKQQEQQILLLLIHTVIQQTTPSDHTNISILKRHRTCK